MTWSERIDWARVFVVPDVVECRVETATASASASAAAGGRKWIAWPRVRFAAG